MEINPLPKSHHHSSVDTRRQSSVPSSIAKSSDQGQPQPASPEVICNLIISLSSMPTLKSSSNDSVVSSHLSRRTDNNLNPYSLKNSCNKNEKSLEINPSSYKYSNIERLTPKQSIDELRTASSLTRRNKTSPSSSEPSSPGVHSQDYPSNNYSCSPESRRLFPRDPNDFESNSIGKPSIRSGISPKELRHRKSDNWSNRQRKLIQSISKERLYEKDDSRKSNLVKATQKPVNPDRSNDKLPLKMKEGVAHTESRSSYTMSRTKSISLSIPTRDSSLPPKRSPVRVSSDTSRSFKTSNGERSRVPQIRSASFSSRARNSQMDERVRESLESWNTINDLPKYSHAATTSPRISSPPHPMSYEYYANPESGSRAVKDSCNPFPETPNLTSNDGRSASTSPRTSRNSRIFPLEKVNIDDRPSSSRSIDEAVDAYLSSSKLSQKIRHPQTGRLISFSEVGDSEGFAVFCCVGMGLTRFITAFYDELATTLKLRLITPDRPGVGDSEAYADGTSTPLSWPDDVYSICQYLRITKFSILAHSAGAIYALATALRMPQHIRGRIHLLAPWIPPSQMNVMGGQVCMPPNNFLSTSQRILRVLPTPILKAANSSFMSSTTSSFTGSRAKQRRTKYKSFGRDYAGLGGPAGRHVSISGVDKESLRDNSLLFLDQPETENHADFAHLRTEADILAAAANSLAVKERQSTYESKLTHALWNLATQGANPAVDLLVCLERRNTIGFRYVDITRAVVIHHGSKDTRVPLENVQWMGKIMKRCDVRVLNGEGHGLMASASIMSSILTEISKEWEDWMKVTTSMGGIRNEAVMKSLKERASFGNLR